MDPYHQLQTLVSTAGTRSAKKLSEVPAQRDEMCFATSKVLVNLSSELILRFQRRRAADQHMAEVW